jgi:hypothetical protein
MDISSSLPVSSDLKLVYILSFMIAFLMGLMSLVGVVIPDSIYPSLELVRTFMTNDVINLLIGLPILLGSMWLTQRGKLFGLLLWPGALLYILYNYIAYVFGMPSTVISLIYLSIVLLSAYTIFVLLKDINKKSVGAQLAGNVPVKTAGWVQVLFGLTFILRAVGMIIQSSTSQKALPISEMGVLIADLVLSTVWIAGGLLLLRRKSMGYVCGMGFLFAGSMLFIGLILFMLLQPALTHSPLVLIDIFVIFFMGLICFIPFGLYARGVLSIEKPSSLD